MQASLLVNNRHNKVSGHICHHIIGENSGATIVFFGGIHGNEYAGVKALNNVLKHIEPKDVNGEIYGVLGNIKALEENKRFLESDLNRMWTSARLRDLRENDQLTQEQIEQKELLGFINVLLATKKGPLYFIDLHTTSSKSLPFITINDALINRKFSSYFPVPIVLGIEEYLDGPLLSYLNTLGYVSLGFECGQHMDPNAVVNCEAFIHLALNSSGHLKLNGIDEHEKVLKDASGDVSSIFEVIYKYHIKPKEDFEMQLGFESFQNIEKGTLLAITDGIKIYSDFNAKLFMPLYQKSGNDGYFIIRQIPYFFLKLSETLRKIKADNLLTILPGIIWQDKQNGVLKANLSVTRFMAKSIFHLFGYRNKQIDKSHLLLYNRERVSKKEMYKNELWYKKSRTL